MKGYRGSAWVYYVDDDRGRIKIGYSLNPWNRIKEFQTVNPEAEINVMESVESRDVEWIRHRQFEKEHLAGEWFQKSDRLRDWLDFLQAIGWTEAALKSFREQGVPR
jgi:hypothetical protein